MVSFQFVRFETEITGNNDEEGDEDVEDRFSSSLVGMSTVSVRRSKFDRASSAW